MALGIGIAILSAGRADAGLLVFTDRAEWESHLSNVQTIDFDDEPTGELTIGANSFGDFTVNTQLNGSNSENFNRVVGAGGAFDIDGSTHLTLDLDQSDAVSLNQYSFENAVFGFGADYLSSTNFSGLTATINGETINFIDYLPSPGDGFLGIISDAAFSSVDFGLSGDRDNEYFGTDNVSFGTALVPEPSSLLGLFTMLGVGITMKRRSLSKS